VTQNWTEITTHWQGEMAFSASNEAGGQVQLSNQDGSPAVGPMQLLLAALGGCTGMDIVSILKKKRLDLADFKVVVRSRRAEDYPMVWQEIEVTYLLWGNDLKARDVEQAIELSEEKYCSVGIMLGKAAPIHSSYKILKPGEPVE